MHAPASLAAAARRYRDLHLEYSALRVVGRGLFLAVMLMVAFLYVLSRATDVLPGANEVVIPTTSLSADVDLGALASGAFSQTSASVVSIIGALSLIISALLSGHALRDGTRRAMLGEAADRVRLLSWGTVIVAAALSVIVLVTWLLTLATSIRYRAWVTLLGGDVGTGAVNAGKALVVLISLALVAGGVLVSVRVITGTLSSRSLVASLVIAVVVVGANFFLLYTYVGALINPNVSAGLVLILTLLLWVNIVVRVHLGTLAWAFTGPTSSGRAGRAG